MTRFISRVLNRYALSVPIYNWHIGVAWVPWPRVVWDELALVRHVTVGYKSSHAHTSTPVLHTVLLLDPLLGMKHSGFKRNVSLLWCCASLCTCVGNVCAQRLCTEHIPDNRCNSCMQL
jgi:hypothetical protein